jgi:subtilase family serine protease
MTKFKYLLLCILLLTLAQQAGADYRFDGTPIVSVTNGTVAGGIYVDGGHGIADAKSVPYTESFDLPGDVVYARMYVGVWGGTPDYTGTVETTINGESLGTLNLAGEADSNPNVVCTGYGVYLVTYTVTSHLTKGANTASVTTAGDIDGRVYGITLAAVYENKGTADVEYWLNDGHENLNYKTPHDECTTSFSAATSTNPNVSLTVGYLCGDRGEKDYLYMNGNQIGGDDVADSMGDSAYGFDLKGNALLFERGDETAIHPFITVLVLQNATAGPPTPDTKPDLVIEEIKTPSRVFADKDNTIEVVIRNQADYDVKDAFNVELFANGFSIGSISVPDLGARENKTLTFIWNPDETIRYTLSAKVEVNDVIDEADETNNEAVLALDVTRHNQR